MLATELSARGVSFHPLSVSWGSARQRRTKQRVACPSSPAASTAMAGPQHHRYGAMVLPVQSLPATALAAAMTCAVLGVNLNGATTT